jgi:hypothetical protein
LFVILLAVFLGIIFVSGVSAQSAADKATKTAKETAPAPERKTETKAAPKATLLRYGGEVTAVDMAAKTLTVKGKNGDMTFDMTDVKMMGEPKAGDRVMVQYTKKDGKMIADSVVGMMSPRKAPKKETEAAPAQ